MHLCGIFLNTAFPWPVEAVCPVMYEFKVVHNSGFFFYFDTVRDAVNQSKVSHWQGTATFYFKEAFY